MEVDVVVIGAGFAGLSAAVRLARDGARVVVVEAKARLGGRATAFPDKDTGELVDNGQHVLLGCYTETFAFLREIGAADSVRLERQLAVTMIDRQGRRSRFVCPPLPPPLHLVAGVLEWDALPWRDRLSVLGLSTPLKHARGELRPGSTRKAASEGETVENWLIRNGQSARLREMLWHPLALAALNQPPAQAAAPAFSRVLAEMFSTDPRGAAIALPAKPLRLMYAEPARDYIEARGGAVMTGAPAKVRVNGDDVEVDVTAIDATTAQDSLVEPLRAQRGRRSFRAASVVSAVPWFALADLFDVVPPPLADLVARARALASSPIVTVNLWFDRRVLDEPFVGLPGRVMQWAFETPSVHGPGGEVGDASHVSLVSSGAPAVVRKHNDELIAIAHEELMEALPEIRRARLRRTAVVREPRATFSLAPGQPARPPTATPLRRFLLAGDWIDTGLPATIESAVRSGHRAAEGCI